MLAWVAGAVCGGICAVSTIEAVSGGGAFLPLIAIAALSGLGALGLSAWSVGAIALHDAPVAGPGGGASEDAFRAALEALPDPVLIVTAAEADDLAGQRVAFANGAARFSLRAQPGALLIGAVRDPQALEAIDEALFGRVERTVSLQTGEVQQRFWRLWASPLPSAPDGAARAVVRLGDETEARRMERMRTDFLANASHELRTPLASLSGFIETLKGPARDDEPARDRFLDIMAAQTGRMSRLVADLLSLSRIELNEHIPPSGATDLSLATADVADALQPLAAAQRAKVVVKALPRDEAVVTGVRDEILQAVQNLADNALKYTPEGETVEVTVTSGLDFNEVAALRGVGGHRLWLVTPDVVEGVRYAVVTVRDAGPGIERDRLPRLTERFYRVEGQKSGDKAGTGLGLAIVKHVMIRHGGGLAVESAPGVGTMFTACFVMDQRAARPTGRRNKTVTPPS
ncbi:MAG TPA: ATP-binding protein [Caulobacteraceae bacterium]